MSWNLEIELTAKPKESVPYENAVLTLDEAFDKLRLQSVSAFASVQHVGYTLNQFVAARAAALELLSFTRDKYPTGCTVRINCDGHTEGDELNFEPHHICVRVQVIPVPHHR